MEEKNLNSIDSIRHLFPRNYNTLLTQTNGMRKSDRILEISELIFLPDAKPVLAAAIQSRYL